MKSSCQSQMVCLGQDSYDMCESHRSATVQRIVSGMISEQASNVYLFRQVRKAWEGHTVRSSSEYYYILADTCAMIRLSYSFIHSFIHSHKNHIYMAAHPKWSALRPFDKKA